MQRLVYGLANVTVLKLKLVAERAREASEDEAEVW